MTRSNFQLRLLLVAWVAWALIQRLKKGLLVVVLLLVSYAALAQPSSAQHPENHCPRVALAVYTMTQQVPGDLEQAVAYLNQVLEFLHHSDPLMTDALYADVALALAGDLDTVVAHREAAALSMHKQALDACYQLMKEIT